jgi:flagellar motility protein MotE (MotC chaperone)
MADKKVERNMRSSEEERPAAPTHALTPTLEKFREREERLRQEDGTAAQTEAAPASELASVAEAAPDSEAAPAAEAVPNSEAAPAMETEPGEEAVQE